MKDLWRRNARDLRTKNEKNKEKKNDRKNILCTRALKALFETTRSTTAYNRKNLQGQSHPLNTH